MKSNTFIKLLALLAILTGSNTEILAYPLEVCNKNTIQNKEQILSCQHSTFKIDKNFYNRSEEIIYSINVNDILNNYSLKEAIKLKIRLSEIKEDLLHEYLKNLKIYEKKLARREIEHEDWLKLITDYALVSYNLELLQYACELKIERV